VAVPNPAKEPLKTEIEKSQDSHEKPVLSACNRCRTEFNRTVVWANEIGMVSWCPSFVFCTTAIAKILARRDQLFHPFNRFNDLTF
jgi:hypothetical protein